MNLVTQLHHNIMKAGSVKLNQTVNSSSQNELIQRFSAPVMCFRIGTTFTVTKLYPFEPNYTKLLLVTSISILEE